MLQFSSDQTYVIDGAMATELERRGANIDDTLWSAKILVETPELIEDVHYDYYRAGADIAITASYQATFAGFSARGLTADDARKLLRRSVVLACRARERFLDETSGGGRPAPLVAASIGPFGAHRHDGSEYRGDYGVSTEKIRDFHRRHLDVLSIAGADLVAFETVPSLAEGEAIVRLLEEYPETPAWLSFSCRDGEQVCHGEDFATCVALAGELPNIIASGVNCTPPQYVESLLQHAATTCNKPLLAYPNSGESWRADSNSWEVSEHDFDLAAGVSCWLADGARLIGGCCRTTPADIELIAELMRA